MKTPQYLCAVCGWRQLSAPQRSANGGASHEICPSCGFESGHSDDDEGFTYEQWRERWVAAGLPWSSAGKPKPKDWNPMRELHSLTKRKRPVIPPNILRKAAALAQNGDKSTPAPAPAKPKANTRTSIGSGSGKKTAAAGAGSKAKPKAKSKR